MKYILLLVIAFTQGCAALDFIKPASDGISVDTELVVGDKQETIATTVTAKKETTTTTNTAESITQTFTTVHEGKTISDIVFMMLVAFLVGWLAMPSTRQMLIMVKKLFRNKNK